MKVTGLFVALMIFSVSAFGQIFTATLNGANEVPSGDPDGSGTAIVTIVGTTVNFTINVSNITLPPTMQHIHMAAAGVNGGIVVDFPGTWVGGTLTGSTTTSTAIAAAIIANPAGHYVNVHTSDFPGGSVRGQLAFSANIPAMSKLLLAVLGGTLALVGALLIRRL